MAVRKLKPIEERDPYAALVLDKFDELSDAERYRWLRDNCVEITRDSGNFQFPDFATVSFTWRRREWFDGKPIVTCDTLNEAIDAEIRSR